VNSLYYCEEPKNAIKEFSRVLKRNGKMVLITPFFYPLHDVPHDRYRFTQSGIEEILGDEFFIEKIVPIGGLFSVPAVLVHSMQKGVTLLFGKKKKAMIEIMAALVLLPLTCLGQIVGLLDILDKSGRFPIYYFTIAKKK
jgi:SAM-dependent methyltransferase